jgi:hypothetical protein
MFHVCWKYPGKYQAWAWHGFENKLFFEGNGLLHFWFLYISSLMAGPEIERLVDVIIWIAILYRLSLVVNQAVY